MAELTRRDLGAGLAAFAIAPNAPAAPAWAQAAPQIGGVLNVGFPSDSKTLDPIHSVQFTERQVLYLVFNTLVRFGPDFSIHPELAESWKIEDGGKRVTFKLRQGVQFHDATPFDAAAVKWNMDRRLDAGVASPQREQLAPIIASTEVMDPHTVAFVLKAPYAGLLSLLGERPGFMVSPTAAEEARQGLRQQPGRYRPIRVQGMGARQPHRRGAQPQVLGSGQALSRSHRSSRHLGRRSLAYSALRRARSIS